MRRFNIKSGKYDRNITLQCPTCGGMQFEFDDDIDEGNAKIQCISCDREMTKDELIHENSENIEVHASEVGKEVLDDLAKEMKKSLKKAFRGSKNIKIK